jgi:hypothetical protein
MKLNTALASLGVDPRHVNQVHRDSARIAGIASGHSPQEAALFLLTMMPMSFQHSASDTTVKKWIEKGKVRVSDEAVREALVTLSFYNPGIGKLAHVH